MDAIPEFGIGSLEPFNARLNPKQDQLSVSEVKVSEIGAKILTPPSSPTRSSLLTQEIHKFKIETEAATKIQTATRAFLANKTMNQALEETESLIASLSPSKGADLKDRKTNEILLKEIARKLINHEFKELPSLDALSAEEQKGVNYVFNEMKSTATSFSKQINQGLEKLQQAMSKFPDHRNLPSRQRESASNYYDHLVSLVLTPMLKMKAHAEKMEKLFEANPKEAFEYLKTFKNDMSRFVANFDQANSLLLQQPNIKELEEWNKDFASLNLGQNFIAPIQRGPRFDLLARELTSQLENVKKSLVEKLSQTPQGEDKNAISTKIKAIDNAIVSADSWLAGSKLFNEYSNMAGRLKS